MNLIFKINLDYIIQPNTIKIVRPDFNTVIMKFDDIINQNGTQDDVFALITKAVDYFVNGNNYTIFA